MSQGRETNLFGWCWGLQQSVVATSRESCDGGSFLDGIMSFGKANIAGLASGREQSEMKSILAGTWPPLKPLPVFKYETADYRATIDFDKLRGEWVCRKTSFPSNMVQELRGGLREITMSLPNGEAEMFVEGSEQAEQELEKDMNRRLQAIRDWRENSESGARYFELRGYLSESQRAEIDDSLRLSLTARQLQFNAKNVACVFDALSTAGGRFATLIEFAKRNKATPGTAPNLQAEGTAPEPEPAIDHGNFSPEVSFRESSPVLSDNIPFVRDQDTEVCADELSALSIKNVLPVQGPSFLADRMEYTASQGFEIEEDRHSSDLSDFAAEARMDRSSEDSTASSSSRLPRLEISAFQVTAFALLFSFTVAALTIGLTLERGSLVRRMLGPSNATSAMDGKSPTPPEQADESPSQTPTPLPASSNESTRASKLDGGAKTTIESKLTGKPEVTSEQRGAIGPIVSNASPPSISNAAPSLKAVVPRSSAPRNPGSYSSTRTAGTAPHLSGPSTILVNVPTRGSRPFRLSFPEKAVAATSSLAITSQLSVLLLPGLRPIEAANPSRLEAGQLASFVLPRYPKPGDRGGAEVIRIRATIGPLGRVRDVKFLSGSNSLFPATMQAIRRWRYKPTLLDKRPIQAQQDLTIEFRPSQYSSQELHPRQKLVAVK
jgi:TonB-like protein